MFQRYYFVNMTSLGLPLCVLSKNAGGLKKRRPQAPVTPAPPPTPEFEAPASSESLLQVSTNAKPIYSCDLYKKLDYFRNTMYHKSKTIQLFWIVTIGQFKHRLFWLEMSTQHLASLKTEPTSMPLMFTVTVLSFQLINDVILLWNFG